MSEDCPFLCNIAVAPSLQKPTQEKAGHKIVYEDRWFNDQPYIEPFDRDPPSEDD
jgi:hypothetical protein